jgi:hypothetical protein
LLACQQELVSKIDFEVAIRCRQPAHVTEGPNLLTLEMVKATDVLQSASRNRAARSARDEVALTVLDKTSGPE